MTVIEIINQIEADKTKRHVVPTHALLLEIINIAYANGFSRKELTLELNSLCKAKKIEWGHTLNDKFFKTK